MDGVAAYPQGAAGAFEARVRQLIAGNPLLVEVIEALLKVWRTTGEQLVTLHRRVLRLAQTDETCRRLMTVPGVGAVTAAAFLAPRRACAAARN